MHNKARLPEIGSYLTKGEETIQETDGAYTGSGDYPQFGKLSPMMKQYPLTMDNENSEEITNDEIFKNQKFHQYSSSQKAHIPRDVSKSKGTPANRHKADNSRLSLSTINDA